MEQPKLFMSLYLIGEMVDYRPGGRYAQEEIVGSYYYWEGKPSMNLGLLHTQKRHIVDMIKPEME